MDKLFTYESLVHATSGSAGACAAMAALYPLDQVRLILQLEENRTVSEKNAALGSVLGTVKDIIDENGIRALYQGHGSTQIALAWSNFIFFYSLQGLKAVLKDLADTELVSPAANLGLTSVAGVLNVLASNPIWVATMGIKADTYPGSNVFGVLSKTYRDGGIGALYSGTGASLLLVANPIIHYTAYESLKGLRIASLAKSSGKGVSDIILSGGDIFVFGALAKCIATILTYPLQLAQTRLRSIRKKAKKDDEKEDKAVAKGGSFLLTLWNGLANEYSATWNFLVNHVKTNGFTAMFQGMGAKLLQTVLNAAFSLLFYEKIVQAVRNALMRQ